MSAPHPRVRRAAHAALAVGAASLLAACGSGQITQTASQDAPVDGGFASSGSVHVNDFRVVVDEESIPDPSGEGQVGFTVAYTADSLADEELTLESVSIDGEDAEISGEAEIPRDCSLTARVQEGSDPEEIEEGQGGTCIKYTEVTLSDVEGLRVGVSVPGQMSFSNGETLDILAGVVARHPEPRNFSREGDESFPDQMAHSDH